MEAVAEGLWLLSQEFQRKGNVAQAVKCLEALCQSSISFLPIVEVKTRLQVAALLLDHTHNLRHAKAHLERAQILLKQIPSCFELKCRVYSMLARCYHLIGTVAPLKQTLKKGLELATSSGGGTAAHMWACNFNLQMARALIIEGDLPSVFRALDAGLQHAASVQSPQLELVFAASVLHIHLTQCDDAAVLEQMVNRCDRLWEQVPPQERPLYLGLDIYNMLLHVVYFLRVCDEKAACEYVECLDRALAVKYERPDEIPEEEKKAIEAQLHYQETEIRQQMQAVRQQLSEPGIANSRKSELYEMYTHLESKLSGVMHQRAALEAVGLTRKIRGDSKLSLGPFPLDGEWLSTGPVLVLVDLMAVVCLRPKGLFNDCSRRLNSGLGLVLDELSNLGVTTTTEEKHLPHWTIYTAGVHLMLLFQLLENQVAIYLTQTQFLQAQATLLDILEICTRFPTILHGCYSSVHVLIGHYAHSVGCFREAAQHFLLGVQCTESQSSQAMCFLFAAISYICLGDAESLSQALDLIGPVYKARDAYIGVREKILALFASGLLLMKQQNLQEGRMRLSIGLKLTHRKLRNHQLLSQFLSVLGSMALAIHDIGQARDILNSSLTLSKTLHDLPTQIAVLSELTAMYREIGETRLEAENHGYEQRKADELRSLIDAAVSTSSHNRIIQHGVTK